MKAAETSEAAAETGTEDGDELESVADATTGLLVDSCQIDLPRDDVVEEIEFERFFLLNLRYGTLQGAPDAAPMRSRMPPVRDRAGPGADDIDIGALSVALYMPFTQQWKLDGYNRGRVVNSFTLAPGEEQTVEIFTWDRVRSAFESATAFDSDQTTESSGSRRDVVDVSNDVSRQTGLELTSGGKVGFKVGVVNVDLNAGMTARAGVNSAEKATRSTIVEATTRSTGHIRTSRTLKVSESRESGREERVTRKLRNANQCHTLTVPFFEVLANYRVATFVRTSEVRLVLLIGSTELSKLQSFTRQTVRVHETSLRLALLDRALAPGFDAARLLDAKDRACAVLCEGCSCGDEPSTGTGTREWDAVVLAARAVATAVDMLRTRTVYFPVSVAWTVPAPEGGLGFNPNIVASGIEDIKRYLFDKALEDGAPRLVSDLAAVGIATGAAAAVSPAQARALHTAIQSLPPPALPLLQNDPGLSDRVGWEIYGAVLVIHPEFISAGIIAGQIRSAAGGLTSYDDEGLLAAIAAFGPAYDAWIAQLAAAEKDAETQAALARIAREEREIRILETYGLRETADAEERLDALLDHLNDPRNIDHYRFAVWNERSGAADDKVIALALAGLVDPTPVGIVGDQLAVPIRLEGEARWSAFFADSIADLVKNTVRDERRHILPTAALYAEAIVGECCACEPGIVTTQKLAADQARLQNELLELEKRRLDARLSATPPLLESGQAATVDLCLVGCACQACHPRRHHHDAEGDAVDADAEPAVAGAAPGT